MSLSSSDPTILNNQCSAQPKYFINDDPKSPGSACRKLYKQKPTAAQNQLISNFCQSMTKFTPQSEDFVYCLLNWDDNSAWKSVLCQKSALQLVPAVQIPGVYEYGKQQMVPSILCQACSGSMQSVFDTLTEQQKLLLDLWIEKNIESPYITPDMMQGIQDYNKLRHKSQYNEFKTKQKTSGKSSSEDLSKALSETWNSIKSHGLTLLIILICIVITLFISSLFKTISKLKQIGQVEQQA